MLMTTRETYEWAYRMFRLEKDSPAHLAIIARELKATPFNKRTKQQQITLKAMASFRDKNRRSPESYPLIIRKENRNITPEFSFFSTYTKYALGQHEKTLKGFNRYTKV